MNKKQFTLYPWPKKKCRVYNTGKGEYTACFNPPLKPGAKIIVSAKKKPKKYKVVEGFWRDVEGKQHTFRDIIPIYTDKDK